MVDFKQKRSDKKDQIIGAAAQVFAQKGFAGAVMAEIAATAGIGKGTIYEYFNSKEDLFFAVFEWLSHKIASAATVRISALGGSAAERLVALNDSVVCSVLKMMDMYSLVMEFWAASSSSVMRKRFKTAFRQAYRDFRAIVTSLIQEGIERGEFTSGVNPESIAAALVGMWDALLLQAWFDDAFEPLKTSKDFLVILLVGLAAEKQKL
ncbi:MAG: TetR/AcrR family transcriptional regulator [Deltaproteobacteria bacterium]|nr:MAG: TetR/AcrR family transcriptional regulator [Deltaproteobacteria bacterium]